MRSVSYEDAAIELLSETGATRVWLGDPNLWHAIYNRRNGDNNVHPATAHKAVMAALARSTKFQITGYIRSPGFVSQRETRHPVYEMLPISTSSVEPRSADARTR